MSYDEDNSNPLDGVATALRNLTPGKETVIDVLKETSEDGTPQQRVTFGERKLQPEKPTQPEIARAEARCHQFHSIDAFCQYVKREASEETCLILADVTDESITATLDESQELDHERVSFAATTHPLFEPWKELIGDATPAIAFALHVMKYRSVIVEPDGREIAMMFSQIKTSKKVVSRAGVGAKALNGVMIETMIGAELKEVEVELPEQITISAPLFLDTDPIDIPLDVLVTDTPNGVVVYLTAPKVEELAFQVFQQFVSKVKKDTGLLVGLGIVQERPWDLVK